MGPGAGALDTHALEHARLPTSSQPQLPSSSAVASFFSKLLRQPKAVVAEPEAEREFSC
jgi:hypothetical protein